MRLLPLLVLTALISVAASAQTAAEYSTIKQSLQTIQQQTANSLLTLDSPSKPANWRDLLHADMAVVTTQASVVQQTARGSVSNAINVPAGSNLQAAIDAALPGDTLLLEAGGVYQGNFVLPVKTGSSYITITSTKLAQLPIDGQRVSPADAAFMPKIVSPNNMPALKAAPGAHHYKVIGVEITVTNGVYTNALIQLGAGSETTDSQLPYAFELDRVYIHGDPAAGGKRGITANAKSVVLKNSYVSDVRSSSQETQAICAWNTPGPLQIINNYLAAGGMGILIGGAEPAFVGVTPSDIVITKNHITRPVAWRSQGVLVKNLLELKTGRRVMISSNILENTWLSGQVGYAVNVKPGSENIKTPAITTDVTFVDNIIRHAAGGFTIAGSNSSGGVLNNVQIRNNLLDDIGASWGGTVALFAIYDADRITIENNTATASVSPTAYIGSDFAPSQNFVFRSNITPYGIYGLKGSGKGDGNSTLGYYFPGAIFSGNVVFGAAVNPANYPAGNFFPAAANSVGWVDMTNGIWKLASTSPYKAVATGTQDPGVNYDTVMAATASVPVGK